jgi:hemerythrin-like domain-containing protein
MVDQMDFNDFQIQLRDLADYLVIAIRLHIFIENNIVFPLALEVISEKKIWENMKNICDEIGYCGYDGR